MIARMSVAVVVVGVLVSGTASASATSWRHVSIERRVGVVEATLSYDARPGPAVGVPADFTAFRRISLVVRRAGTITTERRIRGGVWLQGSLDLTLRNVWGSAEPEALVKTASCGNRCAVQLYAALRRDRRGRVLFHDFGGFWTGPYAWQGQWRRGRFYFVSYDKRFFCRFTSCAGSSVPPQVFAINAIGRGFVDVTRSRPDLVAANATNLWRAYLSYRVKRPTVNAVFGLIAPWCADQYLLGRRAHCDRALAQALAAGYLGDRPAGRTFITSLHNELAAWAYGEK